VRVAYVCMDQGVPVYGAKGCSVHVQEIVRAFTRRGASVDLFAARVGGESPDDFTSAPIRLHHIGRLPGGQTAERERAALAANQQLDATLRREGPFDLVYERYSLWSFAGMHYARDGGIPGLLEVNAPLIEEQARERALENRAAAEVVARQAFAAAHALLAVSRPVAEYLDGFEVTRGRVYVLPNGVDAGRVHPQVPPRRPPESGSFVIGFIGTLKRWHGLQTLVAAFDLLQRSAPEARLLIVGSGPEEPSLVSELQRRNLLERAHFTGPVAPSDIPALLTSMHVAVAPAPAVENFYFSPLKIFEYMAAGLPIVASAVGQMTEIIREDHTGLLCRPDDPAALASALDTLRRDPLLRARIGRTARAAVLESHTWDQALERVLEIAVTCRGSREAHV
jgi:glycosyltransferase involved in cell wall biosynthesis